MRLIWVCAIVLIAAPGLARAQEQNNPDELNRKYQDAIAQLKAAQDRKNELATENEKLTAQVAALQKEIEESKRLAAGFAERTFELRAQYGAWMAFLQRHPTLLNEWKVFLSRSPLAVPSELPEYADPLNPLPATAE